MTDHVSRIPLGNTDAPRTCTACGRSDVMTQLDDAREWEQTDDGRHLVQTAIDPSTADPALAPMAYRCRHCGHLHE
jgi:hypothetical protein